MRDDRSRKRRQSPGHQAVRRLRLCDVYSASGGLSAVAFRRVNGLELCPYPMSGPSPERYSDQVTALSAPTEARSTSTRKTRPSRSASRPTRRGRRREIRAEPAGDGGAGSTSRTSPVRSGARHDDLPRSPPTVGHLDLIRPPNRDRLRGERSARFPEKRPDVCGGGICRYGPASTGQRGESHRRQGVMYVVVRRYSGQGAAELFDLLGQREEDVKELISGVPGFVSYAAFRSVKAA